MLPQSVRSKRQAHATWPQQDGVAGCSAANHGQATRLAGGNAQPGACAWTANGNGNGNGTDDDGTQDVQQPLLLYTTTSHHNSHQILPNMPLQPTTVFEGLSLAKMLKSSPAAMRLLRPISAAFANASGHRQMGLRYDDIIPEERDNVQKALGRLTERESYDRAFRMRQAIQLSVMHRELPKEKWLRPEEVRRSEW